MNVTPCGTGGPAHGTNAFPTSHPNPPPRSWEMNCRPDYMVDRADAPAALEALREMGDEIDPHLWASEIRSVAADELWMSPAHGRSSVSIGFTWKKHVEEVHALLPRVEAALAPFTPRPHWGKLFALDPSVLRERLPRYDDFFDLVDSYDPERKFNNPFLDSLRP